MEKNKNTIDTVNLLMAAAKADTIYRDVYLRRARELLRPTLDEPGYRAIGSTPKEIDKLMHRAARDIRTEFRVIPVLKNVIYEPLVLGGAVKLHPLAVVIGIVGGGILFDVPGVLLAIPTMVVFKVFVSSTARQLKAYGLA